MLNMHQKGDHRRRIADSKRIHHDSGRRFRSLPERGWIQLLALRFIHEEPMHGYQLIDEMETREYVQSGRFETGSIYTILSRMEKRGLLTSEQKTAESGRSRRVYSITDKGDKVLEEGLKAIIRRKKITDRLIEYYHEKFADSNKNPTNVDSE